MTVLPETPSFRLDGRRALVTGAGRGIGLAAAAALAGAGASVTLAARTGDEVEAAAEAIRACGGQAEALVLDIADTAAVQAAIAARPAFHAFVNNAGTSRHAPFLEVTEADFDTVLALNLRGCFFAAQAVARRMAEERIPGSIINISSQMGHVGGPNRSVYCASKWAMEGWTKAMAIELAPLGIRANTIGPTFIETPMTKPFFERPEFADWVLSKIKLGRLGQVQDLMGPVVFLASDASALMTGSAMLIDGGWTAE
ncbi:SDR family NAD(P)-dependent oxidoreductase [Belnapia moabensis]|uniref:SDR family NAD(P)-dependent oxidoreductase n=1 Tax=Belnapia moabensis TaxID=365533 RepID=UPI0005BD9B5E|nr:SDR family oxidoreductase [Belnapia moabensis]